MNSIVTVLNMIPAFEAVLIPLRPFDPFPTVHWMVLLILLPFLQTQLISRANLNLKNQLEIDTKQRAELSWFISSKSAFDSFIPKNVVARIHRCSFFMFMFVESIPLSATSLRR